MIIMWDGTPDSFERFLGDLNVNKYGITLTGKWDYQKVDYLDSGGHLMHPDFFLKQLTEMDTFPRPVVTILSESVIFLRGNY